MTRGKSNTLIVQGIEKPRELVSFGGYLERDPIRNYHVEYAEALRVIRASRGRTLFMRCEQQAPVKDQTGAAGGITRVRSISGNARVSRADALSFLDLAFSERGRRECWVRIGICSTCLFIG